MPSIPPRSSLFPYTTLFRSEIIKASRGGSELTLEAVFTSASMDQSGPARIVSLAPESDEPDFALDQDGPDFTFRSEEHTSELQSLTNLVCRLLLEKKKKKNI